MGGTFVEMEYKDPSRRGRYIVIIGVILAVVAGGAAFYLISTAQQQAGQAGLQRVSVVVALQAIPARKLIEATDLEVREVPLDPTNAQGIVSTPDRVIGRVSSVTILAGQMVTTNLLASSTEGGQFSVLGPDESIGPDTPAWRAISMTVPDDRAVGGLLTPNQTVDVFVTASVNVLTSSDVGIGEDGYYTDKATKISYQNMLILAKAGTFYILKAPIDVAEEISHLQASGASSFSFALRPDVDTRQVDASALGTTTNEVIIRYGLPIPVVFPPFEGPVPTPAPTPVATPGPTPTATPDASASPAP
jgi:Flp pilus assembly protein CpaB